MYAQYIKRILDCILALLASILLSPVLLIIAILVRVKLGSPVVFCQHRPGKNEKIFKLYKFRTMTDARDDTGNLLPDEVRLTKFGRTLRASSLDELPELFNILKGDMAVVGPRPQLVRDMVFMTEEQRRRHSVRPGLTGLAQVNGRNCIPWEEKFQWDLRYIDQGISMKNDMGIIFQTISKVFRHRDIVREGTVSDRDLGDYLLANGKISSEEYTKKQKAAEDLLGV